MACVSLEPNTGNKALFFAGWDFRQRSIIMTPLDGHVGPDRHENRSSELVQALFGRETRLTPSIQ